VIYYIGMSLRAHESLGLQKRRQGLLLGLQNLDYEVELREISKDCRIREYLQICVLIIGKRNDSSVRFYYEFDLRLCLLYLITNRRKSALDVCDSRITLSLLDPKFDRNQMNKFIRRILKKFLYRLLIKVFTFCIPTVIYISRVDLEADQGWIYSRAQLFLVSNGLDPKLIQAGDLFLETGPFLVLGDWSYQPNLEMLACILKLASESSLLQEKRIRLVGPSLHGVDLPSYIQYSPWIEDITEVYRDSCMLLAPMFSGSGVKNKVLESIAVGIPVLGTLMTFKGLPAEFLSSCKIVNFEESAAVEKAILDALKPGNRFLFANSRNDYSWKSVVEKQLGMWLR